MYPRINIYLAITTNIYITTLFFQTYQNDQAGLTSFILNALYRTTGE
jgi:hypothetical protein